MVIADLGPELDLGRQPMLPTETEIEVARFGSGALAFPVAIELRTEREVVQRVWRVVDVGDDAGRVRVAAQRAAGTAVRPVGGVDRNVLRREWRTATGDDCSRGR